MSCDVSPVAMFSMVSCDKFEVCIAFFRRWTNAVGLKYQMFLFFWFVGCFPDDHQIIIGKGISNLQALAACAEEAVSAEGRKCLPCILRTHQDMNIGH